MSFSKDLEKVSLLLDKDSVEEARKEFLQLQASESVEYLLIKGRIEQKFQNWGEALNAYNQVLEKEPENILAKNNLELIENILNFWNPEMFNP